MKFDGPIPGQSLTNEPKNYPWERPPETADPDEAIVHHLTRLGQKKVMNHILDGVQAGLPVSMLTDLMLTGAVAKGIHNIDISLMIAPVVHDYIVNLLEEEGVEFKEFFEEDGDEDVRKNLSVSQAITGLQENMPEKEVVAAEEEQKEMEKMETTEEPPRRGLMSREEVE